MYIYTYTYTYIYMRVCECVETRGEYSIYGAHWWCLCECVCVCICMCLYAWVGVFVCVCACLCSTDAMGECSISGTCWWCTCPWPDSHWFAGSLSTNIRVYNTFFVYTCLLVVHVDLQVLCPQICAHVAYCLSVCVCRLFTLICRILLYPSVYIPFVWYSCACLSFAQSLHLHLHGPCLQINA